MRRLLITGGAGFIGANFVHYWIRRHPSDALIVLDALTYAGNLNSLEAAQEHPEFEFVHGDIRDQELVESLLHEHSIDVLVHFAAESHVDRSISGPDPFIDVNIGGTHALLKAARRVWLDGPDAAPHRFHHVSTDEVYGSLEADDPPFTERTPYAPNSPYAASKAAADHLVRAYRETYGLESTISNCSNNYGPFHYPEKLIPLSILNLLAGKHLPIYGDGNNVRDWLFVDDHCRGIELILEQGKAGHTYNIGGNTEKTNIDLIRELCLLVDEAFAHNPELGERFPDAAAASGRPSSEAITFVPDRLGHDRRYAIDPAKAQRDLGFKPRTAFAEGLRQTFQWYLDHEPWWQAILDGSYHEWIDEQYGGGKA